MSGTLRCHRRRAAPGDPGLGRRLGRLGLGVGCAVLLGGLAACVALPPGDLEPAPASSPAPAGAAVTGEPAGVRVEVAVAADDVAAAADVRVDIHDPRGIGRATVELPAGVTPSRVTLRFHLRGLEQWQFTYGAVTVTGALPGTPPHEPRATVRRAGAATGEAAIGPDSPYWMPATIVAAAGQEASIPLAAGAIEVEAPPDFLSSGERRFEVSWIDFYR